MPGAFAREDDAIEHADRMNGYGLSRYEVVEIDRTDKDDDALALLKGDCDMYQSRSERLSTAMEMICDYIEDTCYKLSTSHVDDSYGSMNNLAHYRYEMDREAYSTMSTIYSLISGATLGEYGGMVPSFPIPDYD